MASFEKQARFIGRRTFNTEVKDTTFRDALIEKPEVFSLDRVRLRPSWFIDANVRKFRFTNVQWCGMPGGNEGSIEKEIAAIEDRRNKKKPKVEDSQIGYPYDVLAKACRELSANAEDNLDYPTANEFHYLSLDLERRESRSKKKDRETRNNLPLVTRTQMFLKQWKVVNWAYWALSGYGDRPLRTTVWIGVVWLAFAVLYTLLGFPQPQSAETQPAEEAGLADPSFWQALAASLGVITLQVKALGSSPTWAHFAVVIEGVLGLLLIALLALALRRKFMRA